eukprot:158978_1
MSTQFICFKTGEYVATYIYVIICCALSGFVAFVSCTIYRYKDTEQIVDRYPRYIFLIMTISTFTSNGITKVLRCNNSKPILISTFSLLWLASFAIQSYLLLWIFFVRLKKVFKKSPLRLSNISNYTYIGMFSGMIILCFIGTICIFVQPELMGFIELAFLGLFAMVMLSLVLLFVYKLIRVYRINSGMDNKDEDLISAITKTTLLTTISISITITNGIFTALWDSENNIVFRWFCHYIVLVDVFTNFICIIMSYKIYKGYYLVICRFIDSKCRDCCTYTAQMDENHNATISQMVTNLSQQNHKNTNEKIEKIENI